MQRNNNTNNNIPNNQANNNRRNNKYNRAIRQKRRNKRRIRQQNGRNFNNNVGTRKRRTFMNINNQYNYKFRKLEKEINTITKMIKNTSLGGGPSVNINSNNKLTTMDPSHSQKEIRYDKLYSAMDMYLMGKYYSFLKTSNMIIRTSTYSTYQFTIPQDQSCAFLFFPYFYPYIKPFVTISDGDGLIKQANAVSNFFTLTGNSFVAHRTNLLTITGNYRLIACTIKVTNTTTNSQKGGSYTLYRTTRNQGQPIIFNDSVDLIPGLVLNINQDLMTSDYNNEPVKYLYNGNQTAIANEYGIIDGNTIFQDSWEYMGCNTALESQGTYLAAGGNSDIFNPQGVNVKYIAKIDPVSTPQTYKIQVFSIFEVTPLSTDIVATLAYKGDKSATAEVVEEAKSTFNLKVAKN